MSTKPTEQAEQAVTYQGTPEEVGAQLFADAMGPTLNDAMTTQPPRLVARMYAGILAIYTGMMLEHCGTQAAIDILHGTAANLEKAVASGEIQSGAQH